MLHGLTAPQLMFVDMTSMPISGQVVLAQLAGYAPEFNAALGGRRCAVGNASVCAYNTVDNTMVSVHACWLHSPHCMHASLRDFPLRSGIVSHPYTQTHIAQCQRQARSKWLMHRV